jgi:RNA recognition motif-containing protein
MKLLIRNLARTTTEADAHAMFESFGRVQSCSIVLDKETGTSKGFGFIEMPMLGEAKAAMKALNGKELDGNKIRVKKAEAKDTSEEGDDADKKTESISNKKKDENISGESVWSKRTKK